MSTLQLLTVCVAIILTGSGVYGVAIEHSTQSLGLSPGKIIGYETYYEE